MVKRRWRLYSAVMQRDRRVEQERQARGLPGLPWYESAEVRMILIVGSLFVIDVSTWLTQLLHPANAIALGIAIVVALGAGGQVLRGIGEQRGSSSLKALGYYLGAAAYLATASAALVNGLADPGVWASSASENRTSQAMDGVFGTHSPARGIADDEERPAVNDDPRVVVGDDPGTDPTRGPQPRRRRRTLRPLLRGGRQRDTERGKIVERGVPVHAIPLRVRLDRDRGTGGDPGPGRIPA